MLVGTTNARHEIQCPLERAEEPMQP